MSPHAALQNHDQNCTLIASQPNLSHVPQILLLILLGVLASLGAPPPTRGCLVEDFEYLTNQTWYRHIRTPTDTHCVRCTCKSDSLLNSVHCFDVPCTAAMCEEGKEDECCKVCKVDTKRSEPESSNYRLPCLHNGKIYQNGDEFSSNVTGLQAQKPNQCIHCMCQSGLVLCRLKTCSSTQCVSQDTKNCCPTCKDEEGSEEEIQSNPVLVTIMVSDGQSTSGASYMLLHYVYVAHGTILHDYSLYDCSAAGVTYSHGSSWQPVIGPFGPMDCVFCKCQYGKIECSRLKCAPLHELPCSKPIQVVGHCCPECSGESDGVSEEILHHPSISVTLDHKIKDVTCLPPQTNILVFRSHAASSSSAYYQYAFQSAGGDFSTRLLTWTVKDGHIGDFSEQHLSKEEFKILMDTFKFKPQGATRTKFMEKFIKKAKKLPDHCGNRCTTKIQRLEQTLHLREVTKRQRCLAQETSFH